MTGPELERFYAHERRQTAHHEAGHAVAAVVRGGTFHGFTLEPTLSHDGGVYVTQEPEHRDFVIFAGPWADARADWGDRPLTDVDGSGLTFHDYLRASMRSNGSDLELYAPEIDQTELFYSGLYGEETVEIPLARDDFWYAELESYWPTIKAVAAIALRGEQITVEYVQGLLRPT